MSTRIINHIYKLKRGTEEAIFEANPLLLAGEPLVVLCDDGIVRLKIGDGKTEYVDLPFINQENDEALQQLTIAYNELVDALDNVLDGTTATQSHIKSLDSKIDKLQTEIDTNKETVETQFTELSDSIQIKKVSDRDRVLSVCNEELSSSISLAYDKDNMLIKLLGRDNADLGCVDTSSFIVSGMLEDVSYDEENNTLTFTWATTSGTTSDTIQLSNIVDPYSPGDGIRIDGTNISIKVDDTSEDFLVITSSGLKVEGIQSLLDVLSAQIADNSNVIDRAVLTITEEVIPRIQHLEQQPTLNEEDVSTIVNASILPLKNDVAELQNSVQNFITEEEVDRKLEEVSVDMNIEIIDGGRITEWPLK